MKFINLIVQAVNNSVLLFNLGRLHFYFRFCRRDGAMKSCNIVASGGKLSGLPYAHYGRNHKQNDKYIEGNWIFLYAFDGNYLFFVFLLLSFRLLRFALLFL